MLSMRLGTSDDGTKPESTTQRRAYDLLADGFGPGFNAPLTAVVDLTDAADADSTLAAFSAAAEQHPGIYAVGDPSVSAAGDTAVVPLVPRPGPTAEETSDPVHDLRHDVVPDVEDRTGPDIPIAGATPANLDPADRAVSAPP